MPSAGPAANPICWSCSFVWIAQAPFGVAALWWERRHDVADQGYVSYLVESFLGFLGHPGTFHRIS